MWKRALACLLAMSLLGISACAEVYAGETVATQLSTVAVNAGGVLDGLSVSVGEVVQAGDIIGTVRAEPVFAAQDGTVAVLHAAEGDDVAGPVLEIAPVELYEIYCTVESAYTSPETQLIHSGEQVYICCKADGTHRAIGIVTQIDSDEYRVETIGGELYVGEVVRLYRDASFSTSQCVGIGTVVSSDAVTYEADGTIVEMCVEEGEAVERGELLFRVADGESTLAVSDVTGVVTEVLAAEGDRVEQGQALASIAPLEGIRVEICVDETAAASIAPGDSASVVLACDDEAEMSGEVESVSKLMSGDGYVVRIRTDAALDRIGLSAEVRIGG